MTKIRKTVINNFNKSNIFILLSFFLVYNCKKNQDYKIEQNIYNNIFNKLLDSTITDYRVLVVPSPSDFKSEDAMNILKEKSKNLKKIKREPLIIRVRDSVIEVNELKKFYKKIKPFLLLDDYKALINNNDSKKPYKININKLVIDKDKYELVYESKDNKWLSKLDKERLSGICQVSRIYFNKEQNIGALSLSIVYGKLNAYGVIVIIKNQNNKWIIDKVIKDWNS